jgi:hypothetical protein
MRKHHEARKEARTKKAYDAGKKQMRASSSPIQDVDSCCWSSNPEAVSQMNNTQQQHLFQRCKARKLAETTAYAMDHKYTSVSSSRCCQT